MATISDLYLGKDSTTISQIPDAPTKTTPDSSFGYALGNAIASPSRSGAWLRDKLDKIQGAVEYSPEELQKMHPEADPGLYQHANTKRFAEYILERDRSNKTLEMLKDYRSRDSIVPNIARDIGYGLVQNLGPVDLVAGAAIGAGVSFAAPVVGIGSVVGGTLTASTLQWAGMEALTGGLTGTFGYLLDKQLEKRTQEKADPMQIPVGIGLGLLTGAAMGYLKNRYVRGGPGLRGAFDSAADDFLKGNGKIDIPEDKITRIPKGNNYSEWSAFDQVHGQASNLLTNSPALLEQNIIKELEGGAKNFLTDIHTPTGEVTLSGRLKYKTYSGAEYFPHDAKPGVKYALTVDGSLMTHHGAEEPFAGSTYLSQTSGDIKAYAASVQQGGMVSEVYTGNMKIANLEEPSTFGKLQKIVKEYTELFDSPPPEGLGPQELIRFIAKQDTAEIIQHDIMQALKTEGYDALSYNTTESLLGRTFKREHTFLFDGPSGADMKAIDVLDGSRGSLPESVLMNNEITQKMYDLTKADGIVSNGKKISLDPYGYFNTDPYFGDEPARMHYIDYFDQKTVDFIVDEKGNNTPDIMPTKLSKLKEEFTAHQKAVKTFESFMEDTEKAPEKPNPKIEALAKEDPNLYPEVIKATDFCFRRTLK